MKDRVHHALRRTCAEAKGEEEAGVLVGVAGNAGGCTEGSVVGRDEMNGKDRREQLVPNFCASLRNLDLTLGAMGGHA